MAMQMQWFRRGENQNLDVSSSFHSFLIPSSEQAGADSFEKSYITQNSLGSFVWMRFLTPFGVEMIGGRIANESESAFGSAASASAQAPVE